MYKGMRCEITEQPLSQLGTVWPLLSSKAGSLVEDIISPVILYNQSAVIYILFAMFGVFTN